MNQLEKISAFLQPRGYDLRKLKGQDLNNSNVVSKALTKQEALDAVKLYSQLEIPILGGDVFYLDRTGRIDWTYDNWYFIRNANENDIEYLKRSIDETEFYITNYQNDTFHNCIFLFNIVYEKQNTREYIDDERNNRIQNEL